MGLAPGVRLGPYEVQTLVGAGGMGEVYKARDSRLDRSVALKVLPAALAADPQFRERFEPEAKSISARSRRRGKTDLYHHALGARDSELIYETPRRGKVGGRLDPGHPPVSQELFYLTADGAVMSVMMKSEGTTGGPPEFTAPTRLFQSPLPAPSLTSDEYDITSDGKTFLFVRPRGDGSDQFITVSINWTAALKK